MSSVGLQKKNVRPSTVNLRAVRVPPFDPCIDTVIGMFHIDEIATKSFFAVFAPLGHLKDRMYIGCRRVGCVVMYVTAIPLDKLNRLRPLVPELLGVASLPDHESLKTLAGVGIVSQNRKGGFLSGKFMTL